MATVRKSIGDDTTENRFIDIVPSQHRYCYIVFALSLSRHRHRNIASSFHRLKPLYIVRWCDSELRGPLRKHITLRLAPTEVVDDKLARGEGVAGQD